MKGNELIVKQIIDEGNLIGNHSFTHHFWFDIWSTKKVISDIAECQILIEHFQPNKKLFRPPYGVTNPNIARALKKYVEDGTKAKEGTICPECEEENTIVYQDGCLTCSSCGYSKCG